MLSLIYIYTYLFLEVEARSQDMFCRYYVLLTRKYMFVCSRSTQRANGVRSFYELHYFLYLVLLLFCMLLTLPAKGMHSFWVLADPTMPLPFIRHTLQVVSGRHTSQAKVVVTRAERRNTVLASFFFR